MSINNRNLGQFSNLLNRIIALFLSSSTHFMFSPCRKAFLSLRRRKHDISQSIRNFYDRKSMHKGGRVRIAIPSVSF
jgi:hypothetical protein